AALPIVFIPNAGQAPPTVRFMVQTPDVRAGFTHSGAVFQIHNRGIEVQFAGSNPRPSIDGTDQQSGRVNFFIGSNSTTNIPVYSGISYRDLYPGIDLHYSGAGSNLKSEFVVAPGADPRKIQLVYHHATVRIDAR